MVELGFFDGANSLAQFFLPKNGVFNNVVDRLMQEDPICVRQLFISLFADDVTVLACNVSRDQAIRDVQWAVNVISD